jgi:hypothetical protein
LLIIVSRAGLGKSSIVEKELEDEVPLVLNSHVTPLAFYRTLAEKVREERDCLIVIDEAEMMFQDSKLKTMLKLLCDTRRDKVIKYTSTTPLLKDLPKEITTDAKVVMLINTLAPSDEQIKAIMSRGHLIYFEPSDAEIFNYLVDWAEDKEIVKFIRGYSQISKALTLRTYVKAEESKRSGLDWEAETLTEMELDDRYLVISRLLKRFKKESERIEHWGKETGLGRVKYFEYKKKYVTRVLGKSLYSDKELKDDEQVLTTLHNPVQ